MPTSLRLPVLVYFVVALVVYVLRRNVPKQHQALMTFLFRVVQLVGFMFAGMLLGLYIHAKTCPKKGDFLIETFLPDLEGISFAANLGAVFGACTYFILWCAIHLAGKLKRRGAG